MVLKFSSLPWERTASRRACSEMTAPNNYALESEQLSRCILFGEKPQVSKEFSLLVARVTDRILREIGY